MKDRQLTFDKEDTTLVEDPKGDLLKAIEKSYNDIKFNIGHLHSQLKAGKLTEGMKATQLSLSEHYVLELQKTLGYEGVLDQQNKERYSEIRSLNIENRDLRKQLGNKVTNEDARERIKNIYDDIWMWWNLEGLGHIKEFSIGQSGRINLTLSGMLCDPYRDKGKTIEEKKVDLEKVGLSFNDDNQTIASDKNFEALSKLLTSKYPSARILETRETNYSNKRVFREITVTIDNLDDIENTK